MSNFFRSLFGAKKAAKVTKSKMQTRRLELIGLEERITPVITATLTGTVLDITTTAGEDIVGIVSASSGVITINATAGGSAVAVVAGAGVTVGGSAGANTLTLATPANLTQLSLVGDAVGNQDFTITGIDSTAYNANFGLSVNMGADTFGPDSLNFSTAVVTLKGSGALATSNIDAISISSAADITAATGAVSISATTIATAGDVTTSSGAIGFTGAVTLTGATVLTTTGGAVAITGTVNGNANLTTSSGSGPVTITGIVGGSAALSAISVTSTGAIGFTGAVSAVSVATVGAGAVTLGGTVTTSGLVNFAGAVTGTTSVTIAAATTTTFGSTVSSVGAISVTSSGNGAMSFGGTVTGASVTTVGTGLVTLGGTVTTTGATNFGGAVTGTSVNVVAGTTATITGALNSTGLISVVGAGVVTLTGAVGASSLNTGVTVTSTGDNVVISSTVLSGSSVATGAIAISAATAGKTISLANTVTAGLNSNILLTGDVLSNNATLSANGGTGIGTIAITGKVDAATSGNALTITGAASVTLSGAVGSSATVAMGNLTVAGAGTFLASSSVTAANISVTGSATSATFVGAVKTTGTTGLTASTISAGTLTFSSSITNVDATNAADVTLTTATGALSVVGAIVGTNHVIINSTSGNITLGGAISSTGLDSDVLIGFDGTTLTLGNILVSGAVSTTGNGSDIIIATGATGNITTSSTITTSGLDNSGDNPGIVIDADGTGVVTVNGAVSTTGTGVIFINADSINTATGAGTVVTINAIVSTTGTTAGDIFIGINGGTVAVNKAVSAGAAADVVFITTLATDAITIASGANITAGDSVADFGPGHLNLGANITAGTASVTAVGIVLDTSSVNLTGAVSMKTIGTGSDIIVTTVNGAQNLTLEAIDQIALGDVGQTTALGVITVTNSAGVTVAGNFNASVVLTDTTGAVAFNGTNTTLSKLTTAAKGYSVAFGNSSTDTTVIYGAPVFLNTGGVSFQGITSLITGATITGNAASTVALADTIVSGGAFNIGVAGNTGVVSFANNTQLILNSAVASTIANPIAINGGSAGTLNLYGTGTLTLSADSLTGTTGDSISVINGTLNVTGKIANATTATSGTISGPGGTIGTLTVNTGKVDPEGTLTTGAVTFNAATTYIADVLTKTTASNLTSASAINLGGANLSVETVAAGLAVGGTFTIINNTAAITVPVVGTFYNQPEGSTISAKDTAGNTVAFTVSYKGGDGNDVTLKVASITSSTPAPTAPAQPMVAGQPALNKFTAVGADAGGGPLVTITFQNGTYVSFFAYASTFTGGVRVALGDVDGNGSTDVITGAGPGGGPQVNVYNVNNATGAVSLQKSFFAFNAPSFTGGVYVAAGNTNGDAFDDVIVGAGATGGSRVQVYAGSATGVVTTSTLNDFFAYSPAFTGGVVVAAGQRDAVAGDEVITAPASNGGYNIKSFNVNGKGNSPTVVDNFFAFNNTTSVGGLSLAVGSLNSGSISDLIIGTSNGGYGVVIDSATSGIAGTPFAGFTGAIRAGVAEDSNGQDYAVALAGPTGGPRISVFSVGATSLTQTDSLFVMNPSFTGGLFGTPSL